MSRFHRRQFLGDSLLAAAAAVGVPVVASRAQGEPGDAKSADVLRVGVVGVRGRGRAHVGAFKRSKDTEVVAICDADEGVIGGAMKAVPKAKFVRDIRKMLEDDSIDIVSIATPNHWHSLASLWSLQAGKHVYVEKPISHNVAEGRHVVELARQSGKIVQHGTQGRSHKAVRDAISWMRAGGLGRVQLARGLCYKRRTSIGKVDGPRQPPETCDYDLWIGPSPMRPLMRRELHYDWHWVFETGNGDIGNQGVHQMDIARWGLGKNEHPQRVVTCGGRVGYDDDGTTPNTQISLYDYGDAQIIFEVRGLKTRGYPTVEVVNAAAHAAGNGNASDPKAADKPTEGPRIGVVFHCEHGYLVAGSYSKVVAFDLDGKLIKTFRGAGDHFQNFIDAVKSGKKEDLTAESIEGHMSASLCHLGNISYRLGEAKALAVDEPFGKHEAANATFRDCRKHLVASGLDAKATKFVMGPELTFDGKTERFTGGAAQAASALLERQGRGKFHA